MVNYPTNQEGKKFIAMVIFYYRLERNAFIFTERTAGALGEVLI